MAKKTLDESIAQAKDVTIITKKLTQEELNGFVDYVSKLPKAKRDKGVSFASYVKETFYADRDCVVVPDITGLRFNGRETGLRFKGIDTGTIDLQGVDFTGSIIRKAKFEGCNLTDAVFCECDMNDVYFNRSILVNADFRGAILIGATLGESYDFIGQRKAKLDVYQEFIPEEDIDIVPMRDRSSGFSSSYGEERDRRAEIREAQYRNYQKEQEAESAREKEVQRQEETLIKGAKFDTTLSLAYTYQREHSDERNAQRELAKKKLEETLAAKKEELAKKREEINAKIHDSQITRGLLWLLGDEEYTKMTAELEKHDREAPEILAALELSTERDLQQRYLAFREDSFVRAFHHLCEFDPCYKRGSTAKERNAKHMYIDTSVEDVIAYLKAIKEPGKDKLTLNEFVRDKYNEEQLAKEKSARDKGLVGVQYTTIPDDVIVYADCSAGYSKPKDFSGIVFENAHLQGVSFAGSKFHKAQFIGTDISNSSFESCDMSEAIFRRVTAKETNLFRANLQDMHIAEVSDFTSAIIIKANASGAVIHQTNFSMAKGQYAVLDHADILGSAFDGADLTGASLVHATIEKTSMIQVRLDHAVLEHCKMIECDLREASLKEVHAKYAEFRGTQLQHMDARGAEFTEAYFVEHLGKLCDLEGAELERAIMDGVTLYKANLKTANMQFASLKGANIKRTIMEDAQLQFANLEGAIADGLKAARVNMTGAMLKGIQAKGADFQGAILQDVNAQEADLEGAILDKANLLGADFTKAILDRVSMEKAKVNLQTKLKDAESMEGIKAEHLVHVAEGPNGQEIESDTNIREHIEKERLIEDAQSRGFVLKALGNFIQGTGSVIEGVGGFVKQPFSDRIGLKTGAVVGLVIALCVVASVAAPLIPGAWLATPFITTTIAVANLIPGVGILTSSITLAAIPVKMLAVTISATAPTLLTAVGINVSAAALPIIATSAAAVVTTLGSVAGGALAGRYVVQHIKLSHIAAATAGFATGLTSGVFLGPLAPLAGIAGAIAGVASTVVVNTTSEKLLAPITGGRTLDGLLSSGIGWAANLTKHFGGRVGITPEQADLLKEHAAYKQVSREEYAQKLEAEKAKPGPVEQIVVVRVSELSSKLNPSELLLSESIRAIAPISSVGVGGIKQSQEASISQQVAHEDQHIVVASPSPITSPMQSPSIPPTMPAERPVPVGAEPQLDVGMQAPALSVTKEMPIPEVPLAQEGPFVAKVKKRVDKSGEQLDQAGGAGAKKKGKAEKAASKGGEHRSKVPSKKTKSPITKPPEKQADKVGPLEKRHEKAAEQQKTQ